MDDILDKLIEMAQISGRIDVRCRFKGSWYVRHRAACKGGVAHIVTEGAGYIQVENGGTYPVKTGDIVFFPRFTGHVLSSRPSCDNIGDGPEACRSGVFFFKERSGSGPALNLFCARFEYDRQADLINSLPDTVILNIPPQELACMTMLLESEAAKTLPGSSAVVNALASVLLVWIVRHYLQQLGRPSENLLAACRHPHLGGLVQAVLNTPDRPWSIGEMAAEAKLSRAQFMRLFKQQTGTSPYAFVNRTRLQQAALLLRNSAQSVLSVALSVGFRSETHFGKAFKKLYGTSPGNYRKNMLRKNHSARAWHWEI